MDEMALPDDLVEFFQSGREWNYDAAACEMGAVTLKGLPELKVETFHLQTYATPWEAEDPNAEDAEDEEAEAKFYLVPAVSLVKACENYLPEFLLVWLPQEGLYGSGDEEHGHLLTFPGATWKDIAERPAAYMEAQFAPGNGMSQYLRPWPKYPYGRWEK